MWEDAVSRAFSIITNVFVVKKKYLFLYTLCNNICVWLIQGYIHRHAREQLTGQSKQRSRVFIPQFYPVDSFRVFREGCRCKPVIISIIPPWWLITAVVRVVASLRIIIFFPISSLLGALLSFPIDVCPKTGRMKKDWHECFFCRIVFLTFCSS